MKTALRVRAVFHERLIQDRIRRMSLEKIIL